MNTKVCKKCNIEKPEDKFELHYNKMRDVTYRRRVCKQCKYGVISPRTYIKSDNDKYLRLSLSTSKASFKRKHPDFDVSFLTVDWYKKRYEEQEGKCEICKTFKEIGIGRLNIDHCHSNNKMRGLICDKCNTALGGVSDNIKTLKSMIEYLEKYNTFENQIINNNRYE